jgi:hypothetical protein
MIDDMVNQDINDRLARLRKGEDIIPDNPEEIASMQGQEALLKEQFGGQKLADRYAPIPSKPPVTVINPAGYDDAEQIQQAAQKGIGISNRGENPYFTNQIGVPEGVDPRTVVRVQQQPQIPNKPDEEAIAKANAIMSFREHLKQQEPGNSASQADKDAFNAFLKYSTEKFANDYQGKFKTMFQAQQAAAMGDPNAQAILDAEDTRKKKVAGGIEPLEGIVPSGDSAIVDLTPGQQAVVKKIANYEVPLPTGMALRTPYWQGILERTSKYDPSFDVKEYKKRQDVIRDFTAGKSYNNIRSLNTAIAHLGNLAKAGAELKNSSFTPWNLIANKTIAATGDPRIKNYLNAATAVEGELATVFKGTAGTDQEIKQWRENLSNADSPQQIEASINQLVSLLGGRLNALRSGYKNGMGRQADYSFVSEKSSKILQDLGIDPQTLEKGDTQQISQNKQGTIPKTRQEYFDGMKKANPNASDIEINNYLDTKGVK